jgi:hypothetical protein
VVVVKGSAGREVLLANPSFWLSLSLTVEPIPKQMLLLGSLARISLESLSNLSRISLESLESLESLKSLSRLSRESLARVHHTELRDPGWLTGERMASRGISERHSDEIRKEFLEEFGPLL